MKKCILFFIAIVLTYYSNVLGSSTNGQITNNSNWPINIVMYSGNYAPATTTKSAQGRLGQGLVIPAGNNGNFITGTNSVDIFYGEGNLPGIHVNVNYMYSYTFGPSIITQTLGTITDTSVKTGTTTGTTTDTTTGTTSTSGTTTPPATPTTIEKGIASLTADLEILKTAVANIQTLITPTQWVLTQDLQ